MADRRFGRVRVVGGEQGGKYPGGNSLWIEGSAATAVIDPSLDLRARRAEFAGRADLVLLSHPHEDHVAALADFPDAPVAVHREDAVGLGGIDGLMTVYGLDDAPEAEAATREWLAGRFEIAARPDARVFEDGALFDLGDTQVRVFHAPGHTRGHCVLRIEPEGVLFLGDIELSSFGPYYGDAWSDLEDFERSIERVRGIEAEAWVSFHHVGVIDSRAQFLQRLDRFAARIAEREAALLAFLERPRTLAEIAARRFVYPPHADLPFIDPVERRSATQHLERMCRDGRVGRAGDGAWGARR